MIRVGYLNKFSPACVFSHVKRKKVATRKQPMTMVDSVWFQKSCLGVVYTFSQMMFEGSGASMTTMGCPLEMKAS